MVPTTMPIVALRANIIAKFDKPLCATESHTMLAAYHPNQNSEPEYVQVCLHETVGTLDEAYRSHDGFLYIHMVPQNVFG
jgi:hypothetical protein